MLPNPAKLNALQLKTLTLLQEVAKHPMYVTEDEATGEAIIQMLPPAHGNHFHIGSVVVMGKDATGLSNQAVWKALGRKGLVTERPDGKAALTPAGKSYDTGIRDKILHSSDH